MDLIINNLRVPVEKDRVDEYVNAAVTKLGIARNDVTFLKILAKVPDARDQQQFYYEITIAVTVPDTFENTEDFQLYTEKIKINRKPRRMKDKPIIIGCGPAGMFAALEFLDYGIMPIIFERGKRIDERLHDVQAFIKERELDPESNIQFGEGGAGSFSDGKLFSRIRNSVYVDKVLDTFITFGAPKEILYTAKPHVGTDILCKVVRNIREYILAHGGEIHYASKMTDLIVSDDTAVGVVINGEKEYHSSVICLAVGHSARDTFEMIHAKGVIVEQKPISVGFRIEHPVEIINRLRYGNTYKEFPGIGAAAYSFTYNNPKIRKGVYTFCMCPGGEVVNASTENGMLVVNGMSYARRSSAFSNAAIVVTCHTDDYTSTNPLAGIEFQRDIERKAFDAGGRTWRLPAQNLLDFLGGKVSRTLNKNSSKIGVEAADMKTIFPEFITQSLVTAFNTWKEEYPLFVSEYGLLLGAETRTSSPVRIKRNERFESVNIKNLYPIGEGAGYTGGITSSAADAIKAVEALGDCAAAHG